MKLPRICIRITEPWSFGEERAWKPLIGVIVARTIADGTEKFLVRLEEETAFEGGKSRFLVGSSRTVHDIVPKDGADKPILCSYTFIPAERAESPDPFDLSWWRGGGAFIGDMAMLG